MKRFKISIFVFILCSVLLFAGCTKADSATIAKINKLYGDTLETYSALFDGDDRLDLYSNNAYSDNLYNMIVTVGKTGDNQDAVKSLFNVLKEHGEYQILAKAVSDFFAEKTYNYTLVDVPQELHSKLYTAVEELKPALDAVKKAVTGLETTLVNFGKAHANEIPVQESLKNLLDKYRVLIEKLYNISEAYETIYTTYIVKAQPVTVQPIPAYEFNRFLLSSELYLARYYFEKQMVLNQDYDNYFANQYIYNNQTQNFGNNEDYDTTFKTFVEIYDKISNVADPGNPNNSDAKTYYNAGLKKLESLKTGIKNYETAVKKINDYKSKNPGKEIKPTSEVYQYVEYVENFDVEIQNYQNYLKVHFINATY